MFRESEVCPEGGDIVMVSIVEGVVDSAVETVAISDPKNPEGETQGIYRVRK